MRGRLVATVAVAVAVVVVVAIAAGGIGPAADHRAEAQSVAARPNVIVIVTDDQRAGTLDSMPKTTAAFGDAGTTYANAYATTPLCCPSRASILTGRYAHNHGVVDNDIGDDPLDHSQGMVAVLDSIGYRTAVAGKLSNAWQYDETPPHFDDVRMGFPDPETSEDHLSLLARRILADSEAEDDRPWFLWLGTRAPHTPLLPDPEHADSSVPLYLTPGQVEFELSDKPRYVRDAVLEPTRTANEEYQFTDRLDQLAFEQQSRRELLSVDDFVGDLFAALERAGEAENTLAFFISDNGYLAGEHGGLARKNLPYMEAIHVPMMVRWPGRISAGATSTKLVANIDIAPTVYDALDVSPPIDPDGRSLLTGHVRPYLLTERLVGGNWTRFAGLITRRWHLIENLKSSSAAPRTQELYDLKHDPYELENLLKSDRPPPPELLEQLHTTLRAARRCAGAGCS